MSSSGRKRYEEEQRQQDRISDLILERNRLWEALRAIVKSPEDAVRLATAALPRIRKKTLRLEDGSPATPCAHCGKLVDRKKTATLLKKDGTNVLVDSRHFSAAHRDEYPELYAVERPQILPIVRVPHDWVAPPTGLHPTVSTSTGTTITTTLIDHRAAGRGTLRREND